MDRVERHPELSEVLRIAIEGAQRGLWTSLPGIVESFDKEKMTASVRSAITFKRRMPDATESELEMPLLVDVPVLFPTGGGFTLTFPIAPGDECLVVFAARCIDFWWQRGGAQPQAEYRLHDLSDGFALVGPRSQPRVLPNFDDTSAQLRSDDGSAVVEIMPGGKARISAVDIELHASNSYSFDVNGYGQRITALGGNAYQIHNWQTGAIITTINSTIAPPEGP